MSKISVGVVHNHAHIITGDSGFTSVECGHQHVYHPGSSCTGFTLGCSEMHNHPVITSDAGESQPEVDPVVLVDYPVKGERSKLLKNEAQQLVTGVVMEPDTLDTDGEEITAEELEKAAHKFLVTSRVVGKQHTDLAEASLVESYITKEDSVLGNEKVCKGAWVITVKIHSVELWESIQKGEFTGFSIGGFGETT